jgi:DNA-binding IclR family transcriptional regulator
MNGPSQSIAADADSEQAVEIKVLARRGTAVREIARQMGLSRNTVHRYLRDEQAIRYKQREPRATKLDGRAS